MEMITVFIWAFILAVVLVIYSKYRENKKRNRDIEEFERVCSENIMIVDRILYDIEVNRQAEAKLKNLLKSAKEGDKNEQSGISDKC